MEYDAYGYNWDLDDWNEHIERKFYHHYLQKLEQNKYNLTQIIQELEQEESQLL